MAALAPAATGELSKAPTRNTVSLSSQEEELIVQLRSKLMHSDASGGNGQQQPVLIGTGAAVSTPATPHGAVATMLHAAGARSLVERAGAAEGPARQGGSGGEPSTSPRDPSA